ncbi:MAG: thioredoxin-dependent thiol peroxidase [Candidatus Promineifilaceae bacterium]|nr:thioredoxin-dependent thiol peroxidase [Candidatus Promineifilaceae bacterium]
MELKIGDVAPEFELFNDENKLVKLSDYRGQRAIIFFYPRAATPGCTRQACGFRDNFPKIEAANGTVLGISPDTVSDLAKWRKEENLPYNLLADTDHAVADLYGVWGEKSNFGRVYMGIIRSHFIVDADGRLEDVQYKVSPEKSIEQALAKLAQ